MQALIDSTTTFRQFTGVEDGELLPSLPAGVPRLLQVVTDADVEFDELAREISNFPSIAARLLFLANSAWAASSKPTTSLNQACTKLGLSVVRSVALSLSIAAPFNPYRCRKFDPVRYWRDLLLVAEASIRLGKLSNQVQEKDLPVLHTAGVLHSVGMLWFADRYSDEMSAVFEQKQVTPELSVSEIMRAISNTDYNDVGGQLASCWNFPLVLQTVIEQHNNINYKNEFWPLVLTVGCATRLVDVINQEDEELVTDLRLERLQISESQALGVVTQLQDMEERITSLVNSFVRKAGH